MMPKVIGNDSLIARVNEVQGRMYRQSNELERLNKAVRRYKEENAKLRESLEDQEGYDQMLRDRLRQQTELCVKTETENAKLRALCRDMYLVVELLDMDGMALQDHGKSSDWRTLKERYDELTGVDG